MSAPDSSAYRQQALSSAQALVQDIAQINGALTDQQDKLGQELTPLGAEMNGNQAGTIPTWSATPT